ncbi:peptidoglycan editing factor PgeF [Thermogemmatispora sp.]|uniref:peptidoglycan editing factor PgeF n=1 Tax=Thermogemmatispora sp. TaxID=1968838 RepID=UPI001E0B7A45|nr:peptidoglycan editing factor PgeF [Thermogemmatispora sp.]MBX5451395.1 peptidoglycan editing factor PgeF [Thermogemmatispora sp.]
MIEQQAAPARGASSSPVRYLQFEHLIQFPTLVHAIFTRHGGYSQPPCAGLNVSFKEDRPEAAAANRWLALQALGLETWPCATVWQIHSAEVALFASEQWEDWSSDWPYRALQVAGHEVIWTPRPRRRADAIMTAERKVVLALSFADCLPLLFYDPQRQVIALAHAGWRGTARGIALTTVEALRRQFGCAPEELLVGIGPGIGVCCYAVDEPVRELFYGRRDFTELPVRPDLRNLVAESAVFSLVPPSGERPAASSEPQLHLDLWETNRRQLLLAGVKAEHIALAGLCTACHQQDFFSYRAEQGRTGRFPVLMALRPEEA